MKLTQINDPKVRERARQIVGQVNAATQEQAIGLLGELSEKREKKMDGSCFGTHEAGYVDCVRCWLEVPCSRLVERFQTEWADDDGKPAVPGVPE